MVGPRAWSGIKATWSNVEGGVDIVNLRGVDHVRWKHERNGMFSLKSAYQIISQDIEGGRSIWSKVWQQKIPHRCKFHLWLLLHDRLLTNMSKWKRGLHPNGMCSECQERLETTDHLLRECRHAKEVWMGLSIPPSDPSFWHLELAAWFQSNLRNEMDLGGGRWNNLFAVTCWLLWRRRNDRIHLGVVPTTANSVAEINGIVRCMVRADYYNQSFKKPVDFQSCSREGNESAEERVKMFVDGDYAHSTGLVGYGGIIIHGKEKIIESFLCHLHSGDSLSAEPWACIWGLRRAWDNGFRCVRVFNDSMDVVKLSYSSESELHADQDFD